MKADSARPKPAHALELQRGVTRIIFEKAVLLIRQALDRRSQAPVTSPKLRRGEVPQNSVDFPAAWSRRASSASASSFPAFTSRSIWRSHAAASNSANQRRNSASSSAERPETFFSRASSLLIEETIPLLLSRGNASPVSSRPRVPRCEQAAQVPDAANAEGIRGDQWRSFFDRKIVSQPAKITVPNFVPCCAQNCALSAYRC
jgi:hypothetical protein